MSKSVSNKENINISNIIEDNCLYHADKKAKYRIVDLPNTYCSLQLNKVICSKCAVKLVAQGYKVQDLFQNQKEVRQSEIQIFLSLLQDSFKYVDQQQDSLTDKKNDLLKFCVKQKDKLVDYYQKIIFLLNTKLQEQITILNDLENSFIHFYNQKQDELKNIHSELLQMYNDIELNLDNIILQIDQLPYQQIMAQYSKRVKDLQKSVTRLEQEQIQLGRVYYKSTNNRVLGGLVEDTELEIKLVYTSITKQKQTDKYMTANTSRTVQSPSPSTQLTSQLTFPYEQQSDSQYIEKQRSLSQPSSQKFLDILCKVSQNQQKTNKYYSTLIKHKKLNSETIRMDSQIKQQKQYSPQFYR